MRLVWLACATPVLMWAQPGPVDRGKVDPESAARGRALYLLHCINCHGSLAQGTDEGPDLVRSVPVLRDRQGSELGPALTRLSKHKSDFSDPEVADLSGFLKQRIEYVAQDRNASKPPNVLTGDAGAGRIYFNGAGRCAACHSVSGDLAGIGKRYDPVLLQQRFLFPRAVPVAVTVAQSSGERISGTLSRIDDFTVTLRDERGESRSFARGKGLEVILKDPLNEHHELLDKITDRELHDVVTYLGSLQ